MAIRTLFFDVGSTLVYGPSVPALVAELLAMEGRAITPDEVQEAMGRMPRDLLARRATVRTEAEEQEYHTEALPVLLQLLGLTDLNGAMLNRLLENLYGYSSFYSMYPEVLPVLEALRTKGLQLGVISNWEPSLSRLLRDFEIDTYFQVIVPSMAVGFAKPDPRIFALALERAGAAPNEAIHVGNRLEEDVQGAAAAGIRPVWLNRTGDPSEPECVTITDLRGLLYVVGGAQ